jgi:hypothetical protein
VTSAEKSSGRLRGLSLEKVEELKEERGTGREAEPALEVGVPKKQAEGAIPSLSERVLSQKPPKILSQIGFSEETQQIERTHGPATSKKGFRGELEPRKEQTASAESIGAEAGSSPLGETKCVSKNRKKKSKRRMDRNAARMQSYVRRMVPLRVP